MASDNLKCGSPLFPPRPPSGVPRIMPPSRPPVFPRVPVLTVNGEGPDRSGNVVVEPPDLGGKADKVVGAESGNFAGLDGSGNLVDSGKKASDFQPRLAFDSTPAEGSQNPVTSDGIKRAIDAATPGDYEQVKARVAGLEAKVPAQASAQNQLADKDFVNSSIATNTATFRGTYNLVGDLGLATGATHEQVAAAVAVKLAALSVTPDHNDYCFVQVPRTGADPTVIDRIDRYKCSVEGGAASWDYEWSLNNSSFTAVQWTAINSGITSGLVAKLDALPTAESLAAALAGKASKADATLTPIYSDTPLWNWSGLPAGVAPSDDYTPNPIYASGDFRWELILNVGEILLLDDPDGTATRLESPYEFQGESYDVVGVRTDIIGYTLGSQSGKPLQPRGDYQPAGDYATTAAVRSKAGLSIIAWPYSPAGTYNKGDYCIHAYGGYADMLCRCLDDGVTGTFISDHWEAVRLADQTVLKPIYRDTPDVGAWTISRSPDLAIPVYGLYYAPIGDAYAAAGLPSADTEVWWFDMTGESVGLWTTETSRWAASVSRTMQVGLPGGTDIDVVLTGTRTVTYPVVAYQLGRNSDKLLQPRGDYAPATGIQKSALAPDVQTSLGKADTALQTAGGTVTGDLVIDGGSRYGKISLYVSGVDGAYISLTSADGWVASIYPSGLWIVPDMGSGYRINFPASAGTLALVSQVLDTVRQIAPDFTAKGYLANELCSYGGVVYRCKSAYTADASSAKPPSDTAHWEAKKVSELFLPITGGTMAGAIRFRDGNLREEYDFYRKWHLGSFLGELELTSTDNHIILFPVASGTLALLSDTMRFSTTVSYAVGDVVFYNGSLYHCTTAHTAGAWDASHFAEVIGGLSTGTPTAPTPTAGDDSTKVATTAFVKTAADAVPVRYDIPADATAITSASSEVVEGETVTYGSATLADHTANRVSITASVAELRFTFPAVVSGKVRDFGLRVEVGDGTAALTAPALVPVAPTGETITLENVDGTIPALTDGTATAKGVTLLCFSETAPGKFVVKGEQVEEVA